MELLCPQCQQKLTIPDQYAGQLMRCPLCNGTFTAPALTPPPPPAVFSPESPSAPPPLPTAPEPTQQPPSLDPIPETLPPPIPGEYAHALKIVFSPRVIPWITPAGLLCVLLLSFMPWLGALRLLHFDGDAHLGSLNAWNLAFPGD